jgi:hypothetical protein
VSPASRPTLRDGGNAALRAANCQKCAPAEHARLDRPEARRYWTATLARFGLPRKDRATRGTPPHADSFADARRENDRRIGTVRAATSRLGIDEKDVQTDFIQVGIAYDNDGLTAKYFSTQKSIVIVLHDISRMETVLAAHWTPARPMYTVSISRPRDCASIVIASARWRFRQRLTKPATWLPQPD